MLLGGHMRDSNETVIIKLAEYKINKKTWCRSRFLRANNDEASGIAQRAALTYPLAVREIIP